MHRPLGPLENAMEAELDFRRFLTKAELDKIKADIIAGTIKITT